MTLAESISPLDVRRRFLSDLHRPVYHFLSPSNWMNDPNGFIQWKGQYHMFYQHNPDSPAHANMHWGHAVSDDLIHWRDLPIALAPTPSGPDKGGVWSGNAIDYNGVPALMYTGVHPEVQCLAFGSDDLLEWRKYEGNPVIPAPPDGLEVTGFRDPFMWREGDTWYVIVGSGIKGVGGTIFLYRSPDLIHWDYLGQMCTGDQSETGVMWECPSFFPLGDKHVLIVSIIPLAYVEYFVGTYRDFKFEPEHHGRLDYSGLFYAPETILDDQGRRLMIGWLRESREVSQSVAAGWNGAHSIPRILTLRPDNRLNVEPAPELQRLRGQHIQYADMTIQRGTADILPDIQGRSLEICAEFAPGDTPRFGLKLLCSSDGEEQTVIAYDRASQVLMVDRGRSRANPTGVDTLTQAAPLALAPGEPLRLHIFLDHSVIEIFANGHTCLTTRVYPTRADSTGVSVFADAGSALLRQLDVWSLDSIWNL